MSAENVDIIRRGYEDFIATGALSEDIMAPEFVWDMSTFRGWPERKTYEGVEGTREFIADWTASWEDWRTRKRRSAPRVWAKRPRAPEWRVVVAMRKQVANSPLIARGERRGRGAIVGPPPG
jgi:hypothetical protein